jgi:hypothetical protein
MQDRISIVENWMREVIRQRGDLRFDDLHIDSVDTAFSAKSSWLGGTVDCLTMALRLRDAKGWPFLVGAGIQLRSGTDRLGINFSSFAGLESELDESPPSLYLFEPPAHAIIDDPDMSPLPDKYLPPMERRVSSFLREWFDDNDGQYRRSFWLLG